MAIKGTLGLGDDDNNTPFADIEDADDEDSNNADDSGIADVRPLVMPPPPPLCDCGCR